MALIQVCLCVLVCFSYFHLLIYVIEYVLSFRYLGVSMYVGDAVKLYGTHERRKRTVIGITPWGLIENHTDLIGRDVSFYYFLFFYLLITS